MMPLSYGKHRLTSILFYCGYAFLYIPIIIIIVYSFNLSTTIVWGKFSFHWYKILFSNENLLKSGLTSIKIATLSASLAVVLGTTCANISSCTYHRHPSLGLLATIPLVIPEMITGLSLLLFFVWMQNHLGFPQRGMGTIIAAHTTLGASYVTAMVKIKLTSIDPILSEAALDLGAKPSQVFFLIKLPMMTRTLIASWLIAFILSFDDVVLASFTSGPGTTTLPLMIFSSIKVGYSPQINALATCIVLMVSLLIVIVGCIISRKEPL